MNSKSLTTKGTKVHEGKLVVLFSDCRALREFPLCTFEPFVVNFLYFADGNAESIAPVPSGI